MVTIDDVRDLALSLPRTVEALVREQVRFRVGRIVYVGFSQGVAMAYRAAARGPHPARGLIVLGSDMPPEVGDDPSVRLPPVFIGRGERDDWFTAQRLEADLARLARLDVRTTHLVFEGGHEWTPAFFAAAGDFLRAVTREA